MKNLKPLAFIFALFFSYGASAQLTPRQERNLTAFSKLYGYVRYFYPGDEAQQMDWERFAIYGTNKVINLPDDKQLVTELKELYLPIAPAIQIGMGDKEINLDPKTITPPNYAGLNVISYQHMGFGVPGFCSAFASIRLNRRDWAINGEGKADFKPLLKPIDVSKYGGQKFALTIKIRSAWPPNLQVKLLKDSFVYDRLLLRTADSQPITDTTAKIYRFTGTIPPGLKSLAISLGPLKILSGSIDSIRFYIQQGEIQTEIPLQNEDSDSPLPPQKDLMRYEITVDDDSPDAPLFKIHTNIGDCVQTALVKGINFMMPLAVYGDKNATYPKADANALNVLRQQVLATLVTDNTNLYMRLADVIITWNVFQHFFPYWDGASKNPQQLLHNALVKAYTDKDYADLFYTLKLICAALNDGHMFYDSPYDIVSAPVVITKAEGRVLVKFVLDNSLQSTISQGDIIDSIENTEAVQYLNSREQYMPGSPQCKERDALTNLQNGPKGSSLNLVVEHNGIKSKVSILRSAQLDAFRIGSFSLHPLADGEIKDGLFYYNLSDDSISAKMDRQMPQLLKAKAIILDMRGYPQANTDMNSIIEHLLTKPDTTKWMHTPEIIYPDHKITAYHSVGFDLHPILPHISAKIYLLIDASTQSAAESYSGFFKDDKLAILIGQPTAGANGNIPIFKLPGANDMYFSGMLVTNHDGSKNHVTGIVPDIFVEPTIKGIKEGRDEVLERAIMEAGK
jgi:hypothetical protein